MANGARPDRVGEQIRQELAVILAREVHDPGIGFVTLTRVKVSPDLQVARVYYTLIGTPQVKAEAERALERATPFVRRQLGGRMRLRRVPELRFEFDRSVEHQDRIERIIQDLAVERNARETEGAEAPASNEPASEDPASNGRRQDGDDS